MGVYDGSTTQHHKDVVDGLVDCDCKVTESFEYNGVVWTGVHFADECVNPQIGIDILTK